MKNFIKKTGIISLAITSAFVLWLSIQLVYGWAGPTQNPPNENVPELVNITNNPETQMKTGSLNIAGFFYSLSGAIFNEKVGIGNVTPQEKLHLDGGNFLQTANSDPLTKGNWDPNDVNVMDISRSVYVSGKYAYVAGSGSDNLAIVDISNPATPTTVGNWDPNDVNVMYRAYSVYVSGKYAYVAGFASDNLAIVDIQGIDTPTASIGNIAASQINVSDNMDIGNNLYVRTGLNVGAGGISATGDFSVSSTTDAVGGLVIETRDAIQGDPTCDASATGRMWLRTDIVVALPDIGLRACDGINVIKIAAESPATSVLRIIKGSIIYGVFLVSTSDADASRIRIRTISGVMALKKF